jgi:hypothetical protein
MRSGAVWIRSGRAACVQASESGDGDMSATTDVPASITTPDAVLSWLATLEPDDGAPMPDPAE